MSRIFTQRLNQLRDSDAQVLLRQNLRGIEKESLRVDPRGRLAQTPHPEAFGSPMTHPSITTDFSEALLEFITPTYTSAEQCLNALDRIHRQTHGSLDKEILWAASMPCALGPDSSIPVAQYGSSNPATMKTVYRLGLGQRYGRKMQTIAGIHYNYSVAEDLWPLLHELDGSALSLQDYRTERYFGLIRNFHRWCWLLVYLMGAAPAICDSFLPEGADTDLEPWLDHTRLREHGTSLRMGDLGYQSKAQASLNICYNQLDTYIDTLKHAILTPWPDYAAIGVKNGEDWLQLSECLLQIENEFYSPIRPKRVTRSGEIPLGALHDRGVEYIEVRCIDVNPLLPLGIDAQQCRFLDAFLLYCLCADSPPCNDFVTRTGSENLLAVVNRGREPGLVLLDGGEHRPLKAWAEELFEGIDTCAGLLDDANHGTGHRKASDAMRERLENPELTPSAQILADMRNQKLNWSEYMLQASQAQAAAFRSRPLAGTDIDDAEQARLTSLEKLAEIEATGDNSFDDYLANFYRQYDRL